MVELREVLRESGQRWTAQRGAIYAALQGTTAHPTAEELYLTVRARQPRVSLATVYNTLEALVAGGLARKLCGEGPARYDAGMTPHGHARCCTCGRLEDLPPHLLEDAICHLPLPVGFTPSAIMLEIEGTCARCLECGVRNAECGIGTKKTKT